MPDDANAATRTGPTPRIAAGASGYSFKEWKGSFYPETIKAEHMLAWYAERLPTVEINNTFYRIPKRLMLEAWAAGTPDEFQQIAARPAFVASFGIVQQDDVHGSACQTGGNQCRSRRTRGWRHAHPDFERRRHLQPGPGRAG